MNPEKTAEIIHGYLKEVLTPLVKRVKTLERNVEDLQQKGIDYKGVFQKALTYQRGDVLTHNGSAWVCLHNNTTEAPGDSSSWQLMVKCGRDRR